MVLSMPAVTPNLHACGDLRPQQGLAKIDQATNDK